MYSQCLRGGGPGEAQAGKIRFLACWCRARLGTFLSVRVSFVLPSVVGREHSGKKNRFISWSDVGTSRIAFAGCGYREVSRAEPTELVWTGLNWSEEIGTGRREHWDTESMSSSLVLGWVFENYRGLSLNFLQFKWNFYTNTPCSLRPSNIKGTDI